MRLPRNWVSQPLEVGAELQLPNTVARHLQQVLRMKNGQEIILFNGVDGHDYQARLLQADKKKVVAHIHARGDAEAPPKLAIQLALGISRGERMDLAIQKSVELGVTQITPLVTERTQFKLSAQRMEKRFRHWQGIVVNACEQSGRRLLPTLQSPSEIKHWLGRSVENLVFMDPEAEISLADFQPSANNICFLIGPEGGFSDTERSLAISEGATPIRLGPRVLRTETAPLAAIAAAQTLWGDFL